MTKIVLFLKFFSFFVVVVVVDLLQILLVSFLSETVQAWKSGNLFHEKPKICHNSSELTVLWLVSSNHYCQYNYEFLFLSDYKSGNTQNGIISLPQTPIVKYPDNINLKGEDVHYFLVYIYMFHSGLLFLTFIVVVFFSCLFSVPCFFVVHHNYADIWVIP